MEKWPQTFYGYRRENGRAGVRNHVVILPVDDISNAAAEMVGNNIKGTLAIPHSYGRLQFGADLELFFRTIIGTGRNPNVAAVVVIGIEPGWTKRVVEGISETGKPVVQDSASKAREIFPLLLKHPARHRNLSNGLPNFSVKNVLFQTFGYQLNAVNQILLQGWAPILLWVT